MRVFLKLSSLCIALAAACCGCAGSTGGGNTGQPEVNRTPDALTHYRDSVMDSFKLPPKPVFREWTDEEEQRIYNLCKIIETNDIESWKRSRKELLAMGNGAIQRYIGSMIYRLDFDWQKLHSDYELIKQVRPETTPPSLEKDTVWPVVKSELLTIGEQSVPLLMIAVHASKDPQRVALYGEVLAAMAEISLPYLMCSLRETGEFFVRYQILSLLAEFPDDRVVHCLGVVLEQDGDWRLRAQAAKTLGELAFRSSWPTLSQALRKDPDTEVRRQALLALCKIEGAEAMLPVIGALEDSSSELRLLAAAELARKKEPRACGKLIDALDNALRARTPESAAEARQLQLALETISGRAFGLDMRAWRNWWLDEKLKKQ